MIRIIIDNDGRLVSRKRLAPLRGPDVFDIDALFHDFVIEPAKIRLDIPSTRRDNRAANKGSPHQ